MKFLCLGYYDEKKFNALPKPEVAALIAKCKTHDEALRASGKMLMVASLDGPGNAVVARARSGKVVVTDGPFAEAKEMIGAFFLIEVADRAEAIRIASLHPAAHLGEDVGWGVEIRAIGYFDQPRSDLSA